jgi:hypothetical protein
LCQPILSKIAMQIPFIQQHCECPYLIPCLWSSRTVWTCDITKSAWKLLLNQKQVSKGKLWNAFSYIYIHIRTFIIQFIIYSILIC